MPHNSLSGSIDTGHIRFAGSMVYTVSSVLSLGDKNDDMLGEDQSKGPDCRHEHWHEVIHQENQAQAPVELPYPEPSAQLSVHSQTLTSHLIES